MKSFVSAALILAASAHAAQALDAPPLWTGLYAGLNAGYAGGATNANTASAPLEEAPIFLFSGPLGGSGGRTALVNSGAVQTNMGGFIGGGQFGYNFRWGSNVVFGGEVDFQGSTANGHAASTAARQDSFVVTPFCFRFCFLGTTTTSTTRSSVGRTDVATALDWLGTVRGRLGYLVTPELLVFGSGGLAYGGVRATASHSLSLNDASVTIRSSFFAPSVVTTSAASYPTIAGAGRFSDTRVGWVAGGGAEWMFAPRWSLKAEAYYYDLGTAAVASSPVIALNTFGSRMVVNVPATRIRYDGVIARAGVNYHLNWTAPMAVFASN